MKCINMKKKGGDFLKVLIVNDLYKYGGTEVQVFREQEILMKKNHEVIVLTFDNNLKTGFVNNTHFNICVNRSNILKAINRFTINPEIYLKLKRILKLFNPDIIHFNNINYSPFTIILCCRKYSCFQTIRDYSSVCPKGTCIKNNYEICQGYKIEECHQCINKNVYLLLRLINLSMFNKLRKKYVKKFICPSKELTEHCNNNGLNTDCINNPFDLSLIKSNMKIETEDLQIKFLYYGQLKLEKGVDRFIEAFVKAKLPNAKLLLCGKIEKNIESYLKNISYPNVEYLGIKEYNEMLEIVSKVKYIVVPSLWIENYPNTVLESMALSKVVMASDRGGMVSMIDNKNLIFDIMDENDIIEKIRYCYNMKSNTYREIVRRNKNYIEIHNTEQAFYNSILKVFNK